MMTLLIGFCLVIFSVSFAGAESPADHKKVRSMVKELKTLHKAGVALHDKYDLNNISDLKTCVAANKRFRDQGKALMKQTRETTIPISYRTNLVFAADAAFECVYCSESSLKACSKILPELKVVEMKLKDSE